MEDKNELMKNCLYLVKVLVEKSNFGPDGMLFYESAQRSKLNAIIDYSFRKTIELNKRFDTEVPTQVYSEDLVVLSIDGDEPKRYFLTQYDIDKEIVNTKFGISKSFILKRAYEKPWSDIIGMHVGDTITYFSDDDKNEHTIEIISTRRTEYSENINAYDISSRKNTEEEINRKK